MPTLSFGVKKRPVLKPVTPKEVLYLPSQFKKHPRTPQYIVGGFKLPSHLSENIMGNCLETCTFFQQEEEKMEQEEKSGEQRIGFGEEKGFEKSSFRVKILLTKEELEWLLLLLGQKGGKSLQDALEEMEKARCKTESSWKPSLESIMEAPEVQALEA